MKKAIGYIRVSTEQQADKYGPQAQREEIQKYAEEHGYEIVRWVEDCISGVKDERPGFNEILVSKKYEGMDAVIALKTDRIARDLYVYCYYHFLLGKKGIKLIPALEDYETAFGGAAPMMLAAMQYVANEERKNIIMRTTLGKTEKSQQGGFAGGQIPYGYKSVERHLVPEESEVPMIRMIFKLFDEGVTQAEITRQVNAAGYTTRKGSDFLPQQIQSIRKNRKLYEGMMRTRSGEWVEGQHEAIIERRD